MTCPNKTTPDAVGRGEGQANYLLHRDDTPNWGIPSSWVFIPIEGKAPRVKDWPNHPGLSPEGVARLLAAGQNVGLLTGERSGRLLVVDIDGERPEGLPDTVTVKTGSGGTHLYYTVPEGVDIPKANKVNHVAPGVDIRYTGGQVVYPGSVHPGTGALYEWAPGKAPGEIPMAEVPGWVIAALLAPKPQKQAPTLPREPRPQTGQGYHATALQGAAQDIRDAAPGTRNATLNTKSYALAGLGIDAGTIADHLLPAALDTGLPEGEARATIHSGTVAGQAAPRDVSRPEKRPAESVPSVSGQDRNEVSCPAPRALADKYLTDIHPCGTLQWWRGDWWIYDHATGWRAVKTPELYAILSEALKDWSYIHTTARGDAEERTVYAILRESLLRDVVGQLRQPGRSILSDDSDAPLWLDGTPSASDYLPVQNGIVHLPTRQLRQHSPKLFCPHRLAFPFEPTAHPEQWIKFLRQLWPDDEQSIELLKEWFGYLLTSSTRFHKMMLMVGPKRSGKGTIARIAEATIGAASCCSPTLGGLSQNFGAAAIVGKRLAVVGDARLSGRADAAIVTERLLSLSGGDLQTIPRKHQSDWIGTPETKWMLLSNELPRLPDSSGALASRFLLLQTSESFYGREDHGLEARLLAELPGIFNWALDGLARLQERGRFSELAAARDSMEALEDLGSPVAAFVRHSCEVGPGYTTPTSTLYEAFRRWCGDEGIDHVSTNAIFGRDLSAAFPAIRKITFRSGDGRREKNYSGIRVVAPAVTSDFPLHA